MNVLIDATKAFLLILFVLFGLVGFMTGGVSETIGAFFKMDIEDAKEMGMSSFAGYSLEKVTAMMDSLKRLAFST